jgi:putative two-component system response regulator
MPATAPVQAKPKDLAATVLVVDDESSIRALITRWLAPEGYACTEAASADEAWHHISTHDVDLVTLDVMMPGRNGTDLLRAITKAQPDVAVIMLTGASRTETAIEALSHGASAYLLKPFLRDELVFHAHRALERRRLRLERRDHLASLERRVQEQTLAIRRAQEETVHCLVTASLHRDEETSMHIKRIGLISELLAKADGWSATEAEDIRLAAPMHDIGKIGIPDAILRKPEQLTASEYEVMKRHAVIGAEMLAGRKSAMLQMARQIALHHHEHWDGQGYPAGLSGDAIPESARIVRIVDVYDALTHDRVQRRAFPEEQVLGMMHKGAGTLFDPALSALFFLRLPEIKELARQNPDVAGSSAAVMNWGAAGKSRAGMRWPVAARPTCAVVRSDLTGH